MLIQFSVHNFLSFCEPVTLSMVAVPEVDAGSKLDENTFATSQPLRLCHSAALYGANASGKSNLIKAIHIASSLIVKSFTELGPEAGLRIITPFRLRTDKTSQPSGFSFIWIDDDVRFRYEFTLDSERVHEERLYRTPAPTFASAPGAEQELFHRQGLSVRLGADFPEGRDLPKGGFKRHNALFLSYAAQFSGPISTQVIAWFADKLIPISEVDDRTLGNYTANRVLNDLGTAEILQMSQHADLGIARIRGERRLFRAEDLPRDLPTDVAAQLTKQGGIQIFTTHQVFDDQGMPVGAVDFSLGQEESEGTRRFFSLAGPLLDVLQNGRVLIIDEFDARLHPILARALVEQFHGAANPHHAQLIFTTHDVSLLDRSLLRRDQIWFTEKDAQGATDLYSLVGFAVQPTDSLRRDYIQGKYGAIPYVAPIIAPVAPAATREAGLKEPPRGAQ